MAIPNFHKIKKAAIDEKLTKVRYGYVYENGMWQRVWSGASEVTVILGGVEIDTLEVDDEANILPNIAVPSVPSGATFLGWSDSLDNATPLTEYFADGDPKTLYGIYKYNDQTLASNVSLAWDEHGYSTQNIRRSFCNVDGNKFRAVRIQAQAYDTEVAGYNTANNINLYVGVNESTETWVYRQHQDGGIGVDGDHRYITSSGGSVDTTINVPQKSTYAYGRAQGECYKAHLRGTVTGLGRTYVG